MAEKLHLVGVYESHVLRAPSILDVAVPTREHLVLVPVVGRNVSLVLIAEYPNCLIFLFQFHHVLPELWRDLNMCSAWLAQQCSDICFECGVEAGHAYGVSAG